MLEVAAEFREVELERHVVSRTNGYLEEAGDMLIHLTYIILVGEVGHSPFPQSCDVGAIGEQYCISLLAVATGAPSLLEIRFDAVGGFDMYHQSHVGFVDTHTECVGGHHHPYLVGLPVALSFVADTVGKTSMIECGVDIVLAEEIRQFLGLLSVAHVDDGTSVDLVEDMYHLGRLIFGVPHDVGKIAALKTHAEHILCPEMQFVLDIIHDSRCGSCRKRKHRFAGHHIPYIRNLKVGGAEVISPLRDTVGFIHGDETHVDMA